MIPVVNLPGMNCGLCGYRSCEEFAVPLASNPDLIKRCIYLSDNKLKSTHPGQKSTEIKTNYCSGETHQSCVSASCGRQSDTVKVTKNKTEWRDSLDRDFDFYLDQFPEDPGPREVIIPHNPMLTRELEIQKGEILIGRPLGMSCGCPITHCGIVHTVDHRTGVITWFVTGPLDPREKGFKDMGYYIAEGYEGLVTESRVDIKLGMRYFFQPRRCMLNWRHSGLVNYVNRTPDGLQVRVEGLWIG
ncbi:Fe-S cluster protein [Heliobacillus mobilis]|uniref:Fe-S cluster protein n=1 Tax=Heliobacterium mobile TaxID=28064 RepID=A0A6I3SHJ9_HELMO|nr:Fe-S cluster protein [Heliobacterium mobile]